MPVKKTLPEGIYGITAEEFSLGRTNLTVVKQMLEGGIRIIQYREKENKSARQKYLECKEIRKMTLDYGALFIVNDFIDIALLTDADGIHAGQDDLPVPEIRKLMGPAKIIGVSTHSLEQAKKAQAECADYIGVGPIYKTNTKKNVCEPAGLDYLDAVVKNISIPFVAIGGIKLNNIMGVVRHGAKTIALVTEITEAENIKETVLKLSKMLMDK